MGASSFPRRVGSIDPRIEKDRQKRRDGLPVKREEKTGRMVRARGEDGPRIKPSDEAKSVVARDEVNYIMHMTGGRQYKKQSADDEGMPPLN